MKKQVKIALCMSAAVIALVVLFNLLPSGIRPFSGKRSKAGLLTRRRTAPSRHAVSGFMPSEKNGLTAAGLLQIFTAFPFDPMERRTSLRNLRVAKVGKKFYLCAR